MSRRKQLADHVEFLATKFRRDCPFAATVLRCLAASVELDIDAQLAREVLDWMIAECRMSGDELEASIAQAKGPMHDKAKGLNGYSLAELLEANADNPRIDPTLN